MSDAEESYDEAKAAADKAYRDARDAAEDAYQDAVASAEKTYRQAKASAENMREAAAAVTEPIALRIIGLLLVVSAVSVFGLWTLSTYTVSGESLFAVYLSIDLVSFAIIAHIYSLTMAGDELRRIPLLAGSILLILLVGAALAV